MADDEAGATGGHSQANACLNCGTTLSGSYCHACGQQARLHRTLGAFWHDLAHGVLHFEGKIWRTLPLLAWHPGSLTRRYIHGERARFVSPLALFLFSVFLMFAVVSTLGSPIDLSDEPSSASAGTRGQIEAERASKRQRLAALERLVATNQATGRLAAPVARQIAELRRELAMQERAQAAADRLASGEEMRSPPKEEPDEPSITLLTETGWAPLDRAVEKAEKNPTLLLYKLQSTAYKFAWALIPISMPFVWLLFLHRAHYRRTYGAYDHLIFVTYSIAFMMLGAILLTLLRALGLGDAVIGTAISFVPPIHMYRQLRGAYSLSRRSALWRTAALLVFTTVALTIFMILLVVLGVLG